MFQFVRKANFLARPFPQAMIWNMAQAEIEIHKDAIKPGQKVVIIDDLIATGGTVEACCQADRSSWADKVVKIVFLMELAGLEGT